MKEWSTVGFISESPPTSHIVPSIQTGISGAQKKNGRLVFFDQKIKDRQAGLRRGHLAPQLARYVYVKLHRNEMTTSTWDQRSDKNLLTSLFNVS